MEHFENKFAFIENSIEIRMESILTEIRKLEENLFIRINLIERNMIKNDHIAKDSNNFSCIQINLKIPVLRCIGSFYDELSDRGLEKYDKRLKSDKDEILVQQILSEVW
jgi:hypothetical protein